MIAVSKTILADFETPVSAYQSFVERENPSFLNPLKEVSTSVAIRLLVAIHAPSFVKPKMWWNSSKMASPPSVTASKVPYTHLPAKP